MYEPWNLVLTLFILKFKQHVIKDVYLREMNFGGVIKMAVEHITSRESYEKLELSIVLMIPPNNPDRR